MIHKIQLLTNFEEIQKLYKFIQRFPLDYPDYFQWLEKCKRELKLGYKKAFYATNSNEEIIGSIIFQPHKQENKILELKNLRVTSSYEQQGLGSLLEFLTELYAAENGFKRIRGDAHPENPVITFMQKRGYRIEAQESLYTAKKEIILYKDI
ncbi:MAG: GNAT family N-acetyltransferase [Candidatus Pacebacteria bacterium]|nr:GNAT family N-acetyltransferase [Candidatus Paceibacterota bacterium]